MIQNHLSVWPLHRIEQLVGHRRRRLKLKDEIGINDLLGEPSVTIRIGFSIHQVEACADDARYLGNVSQLTFGGRRHDGAKAIWMAVYGLDQNAIVGPVNAG